MAVYWALLLHLYQPPTQLPHILRQVARESYRPLIRLLADHPHVRLTININAVLSETLVDGAHQDVVEGLAWLADRGQIEFTGSAKYHAILPLLPEGEMRRQIRANEATNRRYFGEVYTPRGFFPPEMCYSDRILGPVVDAGHEWVVLSGVACHTSWPVDTVYAGNPLDAPVCFVFRDDVLSNEISFQNIDSARFLERLRDLGRRRQADVYVVTAMDAETYGHHIPGWEQAFLGQTYTSLRQPAAAPGRDGHSAAVPAHLATVGAGAPGGPAPRSGRVGVYRDETPVEVHAVTVSDIVDRFPHQEGCWPLASSWSTSGEDLVGGVPYPLWDDPGNALHKLLWEHVRLCLELVEQAEQCADGAPSQWHAGIARTVMDRGLHSCQFWWASRRPHWDINMVFRGLAEQSQAAVNAARAIEVSGAGGDQKRLAWRRRQAALDAYREIVTELVRA